MAPVPTVLTQSVVADGGELFLSILSHLRRLYPELYGTDVFLARAPEHREFSLVEGEGFSGGTSVTSFSKLGTYVGRFNNLSPLIVGMNNASPSLTHLEYVPP